MIVLKEREVENPLYVAKLDSGVIVYVYDGYAVGSDGKIYKPITRETDNDEVEFIGWSEKNK